MDSTSHDPHRIPPDMALRNSPTPQSPQHRPQQHQRRPSPTGVGAKFAYLMTPEEQTASSFSHDAHDEKRPKLPPLHGLASPPTSPAFQSLPNINDVTGYSPSPPHHRPDDYAAGYGSTVVSHQPTPAFNDAALFPPELERRSSQSPLFSAQEPKAATSNAIVDSPPRSVSHLSPDTAAFSLDFPFSLGIKTPKQAWAYWRACCADATKVGRIQLPVPRGSTTRRDPISVRQLQSIERTHRIARTTTTTARPQRITKPVPHERKPSAASRRAARSRPAAPLIVESPIVVAHSKVLDDKVAKHRRAPATKLRPVGENWADVPDYSPPLSSLANAPKSLKARPVGTSGPLDLSNDPDRAHLHPDELQVAATLRLQCAKYLLNKRKIFKAKVDHLQSAATANFNKTEAQKACTIDVNKASSLYQAFEDVGWFRKSWFEQWL